MSTTETCNTAMEQQFCDHSESVKILNLRQLMKSIGMFKPNLSNLAYAHLKSNFKFRGCLRPIQSLKHLTMKMGFKFYDVIVFFTPEMKTDAKKGILAQK